MNNKVIFAVGATIAAAGASFVTYILTRNYYQTIFEEELDKYSEECRERIDAIVDYYEGGKDAEETVAEEPEEAPEPEEFRNNEGVKKYHHYANSSEESIQSIFSKENVKEVAGAVRFKTDEERKEEEKVTEGQKDILKRPELDDVAGIEELDEEEYNNLDDDRYTRVYLQYDVNEDKLFTNDGDIAEEAYAKQRHELIGNCWRWATDYVDKDCMFYIENDNMMVAFAVEVIFDPNEPMVEVG